MQRPSIPRLPTLKIIMVFMPSTKVVPLSLSLTERPQPQSESQTSLTHVVSETLYDPHYAGQTSIFAAKKKPHTAEIIISMCRNYNSFMFHNNFITFYILSKASCLSNQHIHMYNGVSWHLWPVHTINSSAMNKWDNPSLCKQLNSWLRAACSLV